MDIISRLNFFIQHLGYTNSRLATALNIPKPSLSQILNGRNRKISNELIEKFHIAFPELNISWLLFGEGSMLNAPSGQSAVISSDDISSTNHSPADKMISNTNDSAQIDERKKTSHSEEANIFKTNNATVNDINPVSEAGNSIATGEDSPESFANANTFSSASPSVPKPNNEKASLSKTHESTIGVAKHTIDTNNNAPEMEEIKNSGHPYQTNPIDENFHTNKKHPDSSTNSDFTIANKEKVEQNKVHLQTQNQIKNSASCVFANESGNSVDKKQSNITTPNSEFTFANLNISQNKDNCQQNAITSANKNNIRKIVSIIVFYDDDTFEVTRPGKL